QGKANGAGQPRRTTAQHSEPECAGLHWLSQCQTNRDGEPRPNLANTLLALRSDPALRGLLAYDAMLCAPMLLHPVPANAGQATPDDFSKPRLVTDVDVGQLQEWLQLAGLER